jgi:hypothetical protein
MNCLQVAKVGKVKLYAPKDGYISFFNSPYYAHKKNLGLDIYPSSKNPLTAYSPVTGRVKKIYNFTPPTPKYFEAQQAEQLIILESKVSSKIHIRLLHIDSELEVGEFISVGDELGTIVRSGFFNFWTTPHIHVEVRKKGNLIRAKGSEPIIPYINGKRIRDTREINDAILHVISVEENYILAKSGEPSRIGGIYGLGCTLGRDLGILDGGIPYYPFGGAYITSNNLVKMDDNVKLGSVILGKVVRVLKNLAVFKRIPLRAYINGTHIRGISVFLSFRAQGLVKLIPMTPNELPLVPGETIQLTLR